MNFQSLSFLTFLAVTAAACLTVGRRAPWAGRLLLTVACLVFYIAGGGWQAFLVLAAGMAVTAGVLQHLRGTEETSRRRALLLGCCYHIAVLVVFKYTGFFTGGRLSIGWAPLGLSFFTFQQLWLLKEAYTRQYQPAQGDDLTLFAFFFPTVTSGPILRPGAFFPQLKSEKFLHPDWQDAAAGLYAICIGTAKKVLLAEGFGVIVNNGYAYPERLTTVSAAMVVLGYTLQLYFDFSGYCDVAAGCARLLGLHLPVNFDSPYRSLSVGEFWKRWHITLTTFLRECLYFPLGGSRRGTARTYLNIQIIFLVSGFWHGAGWTFLLWGALHGLAQIVERMLGRRLDKLPAWLRWGLTFAFVNLAWIYFRAPTVAAGNEIVKAVCSLDFAKPMPWLSEGLFTCEQEVIRILLPAIAPWRNLLVTAALYITGLVIALWPRNTIRQMDRFRPTLWRGAALWVLGVWSVLSFSGITQFIYANF
ncbi:MBOAT family protein [uncultured Dysosmobacter sp.]|uniref:MBOAT family O-acyltransferase n=1 Tax=uncultured Dysosmobacter sp. TaxID=2591384 RepID=UPI0026277502|nr:MBOAT family O-acyltransferase [uncultured Dysosmobacter sp.]